MEESPESPEDASADDGMHLPAELQRIVHQFARPISLPLALGAIVEQKIEVRSGAPFNTLEVSRHEEFLQGDKHCTAQARAGAETATVAVDRSVTRIQPYEPYTALRYGTIVQVKRVARGDMVYWVAWDSGKIEACDLEERIRTSSRVVPKRPSWVLEPDIEYLKYTLAQREAARDTWVAKVTEARTLDALFGSC